MLGENAATFDIYLSGTAETPTLGFRWDKEEEEEEEEQEDDDADGEEAKRGTNWIDTMGGNAKNGMELKAGGPYEEVMEQIQNGDDEMGRTKRVQSA
ncbi:unnamed protein product [Caenorhabditis bovis]|uniref:Uncharacterized protein n=1 Tax=Caenorhabditis bovis TaxID=2654633 RepID=A0A8S1F9R2_9PELO|nr:unnamed protein product [Caenorhabditis bovis]